MSYRFWVMIGLALAIVACGVGAARHGHGAEWSRAHAFALVERMLDRVDATDDQRARARTVLSKAVTEVEPWAADPGRLAADLRAAWQADAPDRDTLHRRVDAELEAMRALAHSLLDDGLALHAILEAKQRDVLMRDAGPWWR